MDKHMERLEKLLLDAERYCVLIAKLPTDRPKKLTFIRLAKQFQTVAADLKDDIAAKRDWQSAYSSASK
jgi:hypothetical protein